MSKIYIIHENEDWQLPLRASLQKRALAFEEWFIHKNELNILKSPPDGVFFNRMSASSHTRDHRYAPEMTENILSWLQLHDRKVINGRRAIQLELRKSEQCLALQKFGIQTPKTILVNDPTLLKNAAIELGSFPFILKPNRGGKGLGVQLIHDLIHLDQLIGNEQLPESLDGIYLVQEYIEPKDNSITRVEIIGGQFHYAVRVDCSNGFQLCPADVCQVGDAFCPVGESSGNKPNEKFKIIRNFDNPDITLYEEFMSANHIQIGALEYLTDKHGRRYVYDVNTNTNYNQRAEKKAGLATTAMDKIAEFLEKELEMSYALCP
ncbi:MAG TPA: hypothetical protein VJ917_11275 [Saprospiraceae bacterium]|nr:hypothetical protein [Saprospiraceae bacterium]